MGKIISARVDESVARRIGDLALRLRTSRKRVIERAIDMLARSVEDPSQDDTYARTFGAFISLIAQRAPGCWIFTAL